MIAKIQAAGSCVGHMGNEEWALRTICQQSRLDPVPNPATALVLRQADPDPSGLRYVVSGTRVIGSYTVREVAS